ncbi:hypothetical protein [Frankia sp. R82]|uniref:hypothetical protein n=1 Tax=Frankia sp. R82 TaxID=2950553 RepID=UPI002043B544|nr:hypothetical protein [Frankia sp. R82]MCM3883462.1 hypothetical protein [Frankia sp. R82]
MDHQDVQALLEVAVLVHQLRARSSVRACDELRESNGDRTEFCLGGPWGGSNPRTGGHLAAHLPGVALLAGTPGSARTNAFRIGGESFSWSEEHQYALVAKFTPPTATRPVILICGQTAIANRAAVHLLKRDYRELTETLQSVDRFCLVLRVESTAVYGHEAVNVERDVTELAFRRLEA